MSHIKQIRKNPSNPEEDLDIIITSKGQVIPSEISEAIKGKGSVHVPAFPIYIRETYEKFSKEWPLTFST